MTLVNFTICVIAALFVWSTNRSIPGLSNVATGFVVISLGFALATLMKPWFGRGAIWWGNVAMIGGLLCLLDGALRFRKFPRMPWWLLTGVCTAFLIAQTYLLYMESNRPLRIAILALFMSAIAFAGAGVMSYKVRREDRIVYGIIACAFALYGATQALQVRTAFLTGPDPDRPLRLLVINAAMISALFGVSTATNYKLRERIEKLALLDPLTGLPNRRAFENRLDRVHTRSIATRAPVALIYLDLDRFKSVNDRFGHQVGDLVLAQVAGRLSSVVSPEDCLARLGGDEFALLTERYPTRMAAMSLMNELNQALAEPLSTPNGTLDLTISCGLAFYPDDVGDPSDLVREADAEMYHMKRRVSII